MTVPTCSACGFRLVNGPDDGGAYEGFCKECDAELCSRCAARFEGPEGGSGDDGQGVTYYAICKACAESIAQVPVPPRVVGLIP